MPKKHICPHCGYVRSWSIRRHHRKCKQCKKEWSPKTKYPLIDMRLSEYRLKNIIERFIKQETILSVADECAISVQTAHTVVSRIRTCMEHDVPCMFSGVCEADETYVGGAFKNKHVHERRKGSKRGRGTDKQAVFGIVNRDTEQVRVWLVPKVRMRILLPHIIETIAPGSSVYTDGYKGYRKLPAHGYLHAWVDHDNGEYVRGDVHTQTIDGFWGLMKNKLCATGGIRKNRMHLFVSECVWRYNFRHLTDKEKVNRIYSLLIKFSGSF